MNHDQSHSCDHHGYYLFNNCYDHIYLREEQNMMSNEEQLRRVSMAYEAKLIELMGADAFHEFSTKIAREMFADEICGMADGDFKEAILENFDAITGSDEEYQKLLMMTENIRDCEHCIHHVYYSAGGFYACESWECKFQPKKEDDSDGC